MDVAEFMALPHEEKLKMLEAKLATERAILTEEEAALKGFASRWVNDDPTMPTGRFLNSAREFAKQKNRVDIAADMLEEMKEESNPGQP